MTRFYSRESPLPIHVAVPLFPHMPSMHIRECLAASVSLETHHDDRAKKCHVLLPGCSHVSSIAAHRSLSLEPDLCTRLLLNMVSITLSSSFLNLLDQFPTGLEFGLGKYC